MAEESPPPITERMVNRLRFQSVWRTAVPLALYAPLVMYRGCAWNEGNGDKR